MNPDLPLVSVCIPSYNAGKYIRETIESILTQTYTNIEIIVVDDGSTDDTKKILSSFIESNFKYVFQENAGASTARNKAFSISSGVFIKFMDADDLLSPECISEQFKRLEHRPGSIASGKWGRFYASNRSDFKLIPEKVWKDLPGIDWLVESLTDTGANMMQPGIFLIPRPVVVKAGPWNETLSLIDDFDFMVRVISNSEWVLFCDNAVLMYRSGIFNSLSGKSSPIHMTSAFSSLQLGIAQILKIKNDVNTRRACANTYKRWSYQFYPAHKEMYNQLEYAIEVLGGSDTPIIGGRLFTIMRRLLGWKNAKILKIYLNRKEF